MGMTGNPNSPPENVVRPIPLRDPRRRYAWRRLAVWCLISFVLFESARGVASAASYSRATAQELNSAAPFATKQSSNEQIKTAAMALAANMRKFEEDFEVLDTPVDDPDASTEEKDAEWRASVDRALERSKQKELLFATNYLEQARELRDEMIARLKSGDVAPPYVELDDYESAGPTVLDTGRLVGARPVAAAAIYLEKLSQRLPQP